MLSTGHLFLIFLIVLLFFGAKRLPEIAKAMGKAVNEFKKAKDDVVDAVDTADKAEAKKPEAAQVAKPEESAKKPS